MFPTQDRWSTTPTPAVRDSSPCSVQRPTDRHHQPPHLTCRPRPGLTQNEAAGWRTPGAHLDGKRRERWGREGEPEGALSQAFTAFSCPSPPCRSHPRPPRQGGGHWFEPSGATDARSCPATTTAAPPGSCRPDSARRRPMRRARKARRDRQPQDVTCAAQVGTLPLGPAARLRLSSAVDAVFRAARYSVAVLDGIHGCSSRRRGSHDLASLQAFSRVEPTGIEPVTSCLQSRRSPS